MTTSSDASPGRVSPGVPDPGVGAASATDLPMLDTGRLRLRPFGPEDAEAVRRLTGDPRIRASMVNLPRIDDPGRARAWIATHHTDWIMGKGAVLAVTLAGTGAVVGAVSLALDRSHRRGELGYWIAPEHQRRGYATEATRAVLAYGFDVLDLARIQAMHMAGNRASGRVMEKLGLRPEGTLRSHVLKDGRRHDVVVRATLRDEWSPGGCA